MKCPICGCKGELQAFDDGIWKSYICDYCGAEVKSPEELE